MASAYLAENAEKSAESPLFPFSNRCPWLPSCVLKPFSSMPRIEWDGRALGKKGAVLRSKGWVWVERSVWVALCNRPLGRKELLARLAGYLLGGECGACADRFGTTAEGEQLAMHIEAHLAHISD